MMKSIDIDAIEVRADRATKGTRKPSAKRIVEAMVMDAENPTDGVGMIDFSESRPR